MMMMMMIMYTIVLFGVLSSLPSVAGQIQEEKVEKVWEFLGKISEKDRFSYDICDGRFLDFITGEYGRCYSIEMSVENIIYIKNNTFYYTHAITHYHDEKDDDDDRFANTQQDRLFLIDADQYKVRPIFFEDKDYAASLQNTIFWRGGWGDTVRTQYGAASAVNIQANDPGTAMVISDVSVADNGAMQYTASYDRFERSFFVINDDVPLPVSAAISKYATRHSSNTQELFSFKLKNFETVRYAPVQSTVTYSTAPQDASIQDGAVGVAVQDQVAYPEIVNGHFEVQWR